MLDTRTNEWLAKLQVLGPKIATYGIGALIVAQGAQVVYPLIAKPVVSPQPVVAGRPASRPHNELDIQNVIDAHLFGTAVIDHGPQDEGNAPVSAANLLLAGTIAMRDPKKGVAIISDGGAPAKVYKVDEKIGGAALHSIYLDHVILDRGGVLETLNLPRQPLVNSRVASRRAGGGADPRTVQAVDNIRHMVQQDPAILDQVMRTVASYDNAAGKLRGFRAYPGKNREIFNKLGLKSGDLVTAINGTPLDDPQRSQDVFNTVQTSDHVTVTVERNGQKQDISLNIAQVAAQATKELENGPSSTPGVVPAPPGAVGTIQPPQTPTPGTEIPNE